MLVRWPVVAVRIEGKHSVRVGRVGAASHAGIRLGDLGVCRDGLIGVRLGDGVKFGFPLVRAAASAAMIAAAAVYARGKNQELEEERLDQ